MAPRRSSRLAALQSSNELSSTVKPSAASAEAGAAAFKAPQRSSKKSFSATKRASAAAVTARGAAAAAAAAGAGELKRKRAGGAGKAQVPDRALEVRRKGGGWGGEDGEESRGGRNGAKYRTGRLRMWTGFTHVYGVDEAGRGRARVAGTVVTPHPLLPFPPRSPSFQQSLWARGFKHVYGVDEEGRGPLAGCIPTPYRVHSNPLQGAFQPLTGCIPTPYRVHSLTPPSPTPQQSLWSRGFKHVYGVDEAGRGPLAGPVVAAACAVPAGLVIPGPVVAAACAVPAGLVIPGLADSKKLTEKQREEIFDAIIGNPDIFYAVDIVGPAEIDKINILEATMLAMGNSIAQVVEDPSSPSPDYVLVDGNRVPQGLPCTAEAVIKGDATCYAIAAASILAKVTRDRLMLKFDRLYPAYGFKQHKGYGTAAHMKALLAHGPCPIHRRSFAPIKDWAVLDDK
ncbi:unnamed protein product [Closterium sp. Naga37s-1]|nr:unnamed protein product [Closterium sp. Naga37s-1]